ncbi:preprotein translocase subunit SecE [candidate division KSB1 bacterium]|nr:preprotein translocase subunit SecE [candidate division KSB1 bacterium]
MFQKISKYFSEVGQELSKVSWPSREELYGSTVVVVVLCSILSVFIFGIDFMLNHLIGVIF